jgi:hypothetical protein
MLNAAQGHRSLEGPLAKINNSKELEEWLTYQPREVAVALAVRAAFRFLPTVPKVRRRGFKRDFFARVVLSVFRATGVAWAAAKYPAQATEFRDAAFAAARAAESVANAADSVAVGAVFAAVRAATQADAAANAADAAAFAADAATRHGGPAYGAFWSAVSFDATRVENGATASVTAGSPLWPQRQPDQLRFSWQEMKAALLAAKQDWGVWTDWYEARLEGRVNDEKQELAYVRIEEALWDQGPAAVNAEIKRRIEELEPNPPSIEAIPEQEPIATKFGVNSQGLIDVVLDPPAHGAAADPLQREFYEETRLKAQALVELGPNLLGALNDPANRFRAGLKGRIEDISITSSWSRGNTLRIRLKAHDFSTSNEEPDPGRLHPLVAETLRDVVQTWNIFIVGDPKGRELDEIRVGPQEAESARQGIATAVPIVEAIEHSENVATPTAIEAIVEQAEAAKTAPVGIDGGQAIVLSRKTTGNFVVELLRRAYSLCRSEGAFAWKEYRAAIYRAAGTATAGGIGFVAYDNWPALVSFVARNADALKEFATAAWQNPTLVEIIDWVVRTLT